MARDSSPFMAINSLTHGYYGDFKIMAQIQYSETPGLIQSKWFITGVKEIPI